MTNRFKDVPTRQLIDELMRMGFECPGGSLSTAAAWVELEARRTGKLEELERNNPVNNMAKAVERFQREVLNHPIPDKPIMLLGDAFAFKANHLEEELSEFADATNIEEQADALIDLTYVALGALIQMGLTPGPLFSEVHRANMERKLGINERTIDGIPDTVKPEDWKAPDLMPYLTATRTGLRWLNEQEDIADDYEENHVKYEKAMAEDEECIAEPDGNCVAEGDCMHRHAERPRILVIGHAQHGKDTVCEMLHGRHGLHFTSSSQFCAEKVIWPLLQDPIRATPFLDSNSQDMRDEWLKMSAKDYGSAQDCFEDRANHRTFWYEAIRDFNRGDPARLARAILEENDVYCGLRSADELAAVEKAGLFDTIVWVDRSHHIGPESELSCTVTSDMADLHMDNNGSLRDLERSVDGLMDLIMEGPTS